MFLKELALAGAVTLLSSTTALAGCGLSAGNVNILAMTLRQFRRLWAQLKTVRAMV